MRRFQIPEIILGSLLTVAIFTIGVIFGLRTTASADAEVTGFPLRERRCVMKPMRPTEGWPPHRCGEPEIATVCYPCDPFERAGGADIGLKHHVLTAASVTVGRRTNQRARPAIGTSTIATATNRTVAEATTKATGRSCWRWRPNLDRSARQDDDRIFRAWGGR
jgi:hypothetical protein